MKNSPPPKTTPLITKTMAGSSGLPSLLMEAALSAAVADGVIPPLNDGGKKVNEGGVESKDGADDDMLAAQHRPPMPSMMRSSVGNGMVNAAEVDLSSVMAAVAAQSHAAIEAESFTLASEGSLEKRNPLRRGKWTAEEEAYANRLIQEFKEGLLPLTDGTTLRTFLSKLLNCDPMRISKKFVGSNCIGKQIFRRRSADVNNLTPDEIERTRFELSELEKKFLDRVAQSKSSKGGGSGGASKSSRVGGNMSSSRGGGALGNSMNKSAAAVGRALLLGSKAPQAHALQGSADMDGAGGLLAKLQAQNPGMFDENTAGSFLSGGSQAGGLGNMNTTASLTNLMLQTGMSRNQISLLAGKGVYSSASLANMLGKQRSFDQLMSLDFQSMQSIDNLANLIHAGMPNTGVPKAQMKNMEWGTQWAGAPAPGHLSYGGEAKGSIENLVRVLSGGAVGDTNYVNNRANATNFSNFLQGTTQQGNNIAGGQIGGAPTNDLANFIQSLQQQHTQQQGNNINYSNILQNMASGNAGGTSLLQNSNNQNIGGSNDLMNMLNQSAPSTGNFSQQQSFNPFMQQLNPQFGGISQGNPMMQFLAQAGGANNMANLLSQQNGYAGLAGGLNNPLGNLGTALGGNFDNFGSNFNTAPAGNQQNTAALLQQLIAQQNGGGGANNNRAGAPNADQGLDRKSSGDINPTSGNKRSMDNIKSGGEGDGDGGPRKKQMVAL